MQEYAIPTKLSLTYYYKAASPIIFTFKVVLPRKWNMSVPKSYSQPETRGRHVVYNIRICCVFISDVLMFRKTNEQQLQ